MTMLTAPLIQLTLAGNYVVLIITSHSIILLDLCVASCQSVQGYLQRCFQQYLPRVEAASVSHASPPVVFILERVKGSFCHI